MDDNGHDRRADSVGAPALAGLPLGGSAASSAPTWDSWSEFLLRTLAEALSAGADDA